MPIPMGWRIRALLRAWFPAGQHSFIQNRPYVMMAVVLLDTPKRRLGSTDMRGPDHKAQVRLLLCGTIDTAVLRNLHRILHQQGTRKYRGRTDRTTRFQGIEDEYRAWPSLPSPAGEPKVPMWGETRKRLIQLSRAQPLEQRNGNATRSCLGIVPIQ